MTIERSDRITAKVNTPHITVADLRDLLMGVTGSAKVTFTPLLGGDQRDPYPVGLTIVIDVPVESVRGGNMVDGPMIPTR